MRSELCERSPVRAGKKLMLLLVVLAMCLPSYGIILVYDVTTKINGAVSIKGQPDSNDWVIKGKTAKAYFIVDAATNGTGNVASAKFLPFGKDPNNNKVFVQNSSIVIAGNKATILPNDKKGHDIWMLDITSVTNALAEVNDVDVTAAKVVGKTITFKAHGITFGELSTSLSGSAIAGSNGDEADGDPEVFGTGAMTIKFDHKLTTNAFENSLSFNATVSDIEDLLTSKHYTGVTR
ncbi:MAG: hypothetical protein ABSB91_02320 [Sedimentisphaerales bacterium]